MSTLRKLLPLALFVGAPFWAQAGPPSAQGNDSKPQTTQSSPSPDSDQKPPPDQTSAATPADSTKLEPVKIVKAKYSGEARARALQGEVVVKIVVSETGDVESAQVISGDPILAESAVDAAKKWKFKPFIKNGKAMKASTKLPFDFAFTDKIMKEGVSADQSAISDQKRSLEPSSDSSSLTAGPAAASDGTVKRVRVAAGLSQGLLIRQVAPVYPYDAQRAHIQGTVVLRAIINKKGQIENLSLVSGHPMLVPAAIGAVQQWRYKPYLLNGEPMEVDTEILVNFKLSNR